MVRRAVASEPRRCSHSTQHLDAAPHSVTPAERCTVLQGTDIHFAQELEHRDESTNTNMLQKHYHGGSTDARDIAAAAEMWALSFSFFAAHF